MESGRLVMTSFYPSWQRMCTTIERSGTVAATHLQAQADVTSSSQRDIECRAKGRDTLRQDEQTCGCARLRRCPRSVSRCPHSINSAPLPTRRFSYAVSGLVLNRIFFSIYILVYIYNLKLFPTQFCIFVDFPSSVI